MEEVSQARVIPFASTAASLATDRDVLMCYQLLLGRDPESSYVIQEAKTQPLRSLFEAFMQSGEFSDRVSGPFNRCEPLAHDGETLGPSAEQLVWLTQKLRLTRRTASALTAARSWRALFLVLFTIPGFAPARAPVPPQLVGAIDSVRGHQVRGWCIDAAEADRSVTLTMLADGEVAGHCTCQLPRHDVQAALGGDGRCGFEYEISENLRERSFMLTALDENGTVVLGPLHVPASQTAAVETAALCSRLDRLEVFAQQLAEILPNFSSELRQTAQILMPARSKSGQVGHDTAAGRVIPFDSERKAKPAGPPELHVVAG